MDEEKFEEIVRKIYEDEDEDGALCHVSIGVDEYNDAFVTFLDGPFKGLSMRLENYRID